MGMQDSIKVREQVSGTISHSAWRSINVNLTMVKHQSERSVLIAMPHNSDFDGYAFWHPSKLVRDGRNSGSVSIAYSDDFVFHLKKYGSGKWNSREVIAEVDIGADDFTEAFAETDANIESPNTEVDFETHKPDQIDPIPNPKPLEELKDDE